MRCDALEGNPGALGAAAACLITVAILAACSIGAVPPLNYGIRYNFFNKYADTSTVYSSGRYFIGPWNTFLLFPASVQTVEFTGERRLWQSGVRYPALHTRTKEGLALHLQVSLQYKLTQHRLGQLYAEFNTAYEQMFISTIRDTLIRVAADYEAYQLWSARGKVGAKMQSMVHQALQRTYAECWGLQLMVIELPTQFDDSIVLTQVQKQAVTTSQYQQTAAQIRARTLVIAAEYGRKVTVIMAGGKANYTLVTKTAKALARQKTLGTESDVFHNIKDLLNLSPENLVVYQQYSAVQMQPNATLFYGFDEGTSMMMGMPSNMHSQQHGQAPAPATAGAPFPPQRRLEASDEL